MCQATCLALWFKDSHSSTEPHQTGHLDFLRLHSLICRIKIFSNQLISIAHLLCISTSHDLVNIFLRRTLYSCHFYCHPHKRRRKWICASSRSLACGLRISSLESDSGTCVLIYSSPSTHCRGTKGDDSQDVLSTRPATKSSKDRISIG